MRAGATASGAAASAPAERGVYPGLAAMKLGKLELRALAMWIRADGQGADAGPKTARSRRRGRSRRKLVPVVTAVPQTCVNGVIARKKVSFTLKGAS